MKQKDKKPLKAKEDTPKNVLKIKKGKECSIFFYHFKAQKEII